MRRGRRAARSFVVGALPRFALDGPWKNLLVQGIEFIRHDSKIQRPRATNGRQVASEVNKDTAPISEPWLSSP